MPTTFAASSLHLRLPKASAAPLWGVGPIDSITNDFCFAFAASRVPHRFTHHLVPLVFCAPTAPMFGACCLSPVKLVP